MAPSSSITVQDNIVFPGTIRVPLTVKFLTSRSQISCSTAILPAISGFTKPFLTLDYKNEELEDLLYNEHYEFIGISSANNFMVDNINKLTIQIRNIIEKKVPVVLGGNLVNTYKKTNEKLKVDLVSQNIEQFLIELNLKYNKNSLKII